MIKYASQWSVGSGKGDLERKTAEMIKSAVYFTAGAQNPPKQVKFDFYYMHCVNCSIFFPTFNAQPWLSQANKIRLLEWKGYLDLVMYASRRSPAPLLDEIANYAPKKPSTKNSPSEAAAGGQTSWPGIFQRLFEYGDDGHAVKLGRAVAHGQAFCEKYEKDGEEWCVVKGDMWEKIGHMVIDSVEDKGATWVRSAGFKEAWEEYGDRDVSGRL